MDYAAETSAKALSIRQPWAWLIVNRFKDIENRNWATKVRGRVFVHASMCMTYEEWLSAIRFAHHQCGVSKADLQRGCEFEQLKRGGFVGSVEIVDCVESSSSKWFVGEKGFVLRDASAGRFTQMKGRLGFFNVPQELTAIVHGAEPRLDVQQAACVSGTVTD